ncbi:MULTISPECIES: diadenylate cyclase CdaA [Emticicia]|uniref:diadenylate cyclase CdaA n=1 Tax=Emticicia TaxID=312278 RepID=UPI0020A18091|nr:MULTISPECIES: diadenylate cyclase CdaA [Emticicia]UTA69920.1 diadenylate cyclase CdaA [Emticicia sp. 21SJ11W-3]
MQIGFLEIKWTDVLDVVLVAFLLYYIYNLVRGSVASKVFLGYLLIYLFYLIVKAIGLELLTRIMEYFMGVGAVALIVLFQQEIRRFLLLIGKSTTLTNNKFFAKLLGTKLEEEESTTPLKIITEATKAMSSEFTGGIIVIQKDDDLSKFVESGDVLDALLSKKLLISIFSQYSLLNDGAVVISRNRIQAAHCILPIASSDELPTHYGFRHRAALGISEATDAAAICISEENGRISLALDGNIKVVTPVELERELSAYFLDQMQ